MMRNFTDYGAGLSAQLKHGGLLCLALTVLGIHAAVAAVGEPSAVIEAISMTDDGALSTKEDPAATLWSRVQESVVELRLAPPVHQSIVLTQKLAAKEASAPLRLHVSAATDRKRIYFRLRWKDRTLDDHRGIDAFVDGAAIEIPMEAADTSSIMGSSDRPVSIWRWNAGRNIAEAYVAGGPGSLTRAKSAELRGEGAYRSLKNPEKNEWLVVISQDLDDTEGGWTSLRSRKRFAVAFAIWQGSDRQRGGFKKVSDWTSVTLPESAR